ncbi:MAG TPA: thiol:disulfide interchange protein DsbA/DsbL [Burkholderiales bacterium]|nr:thiol:disulfide interchange protein DsbA/DsbL [Burkholderiales bacterium]
MRAALALLVLAWAAAIAHAQDTRVRQNIEYLVIAPQPVATGDRIEVIDFFWYGCPACNAFQPDLEAWIRRMPPDVALRRIPAIFRDSWAPYVRIYYTLERLGEVGRLHLKVYDSYHIDALNMSRPDVMVEWAVRNGIDRKRWLDAYSSPEVDTQIERARALTAAYAIPGTPSLVVDGRYLATWDLVDGNPRAMVAVLEDLVRLARRDRAGR